MRQRQSTISCSNVCHLTVHWLLHSFQWNAESSNVAPLKIIQAIVHAAAQMRSVSATVKESLGLPSWETFRTSLMAFLPTDPYELQPLITRTLHHRLPKSLKRRPRTMIIDYHLRPYYGNKKTKGVYRGQAKAGTKTFFAYATLMVVRRGQTFTIALTHVVKGEEQTRIIKRLLDQAAKAGLRPRRLLLDRGFYAAQTMLWLQNANIDFVMPMIRRGKNAKTKKACTGTAQFFVKNRRGWTTYTWKARPRRKGRKQKALSVTVDVCMTPRSQAEGKKSKRTGPLVFACRGIRMSPKEIAALYRKRFQIETTYRQLGQGLAVTCSKNPVYRLLLATVALALRNIWVWLHWQCLSEKTAEGRKLRLHKLTLRRLTAWLIRVLNQLLEIETCIATT